MRIRNRPKTAHCFQRQDNLNLGLVISSELDLHEINLAFWREAGWFISNDQRSDSTVRKLEAFKTCFKGLPQNRFHLVLKVFPESLRSRPELAGLRGNLQGTILQTAVRR